MRTNKNAEFLVSTTTTTMVCGGEENERFFSLWFPTFFFFLQPTFLCGISLSDDSRVPF